MGSYGIKLSSRQRNRHEFSLSSRAERLSHLRAKEELLPDVNVSRRLVVDLTGEQKVPYVALALFVGPGLPDVLEPRPVVGGVEEPPDSRRGYQNLVGTRERRSQWLHSNALCRIGSIFPRAAAELCMQKRR